MESVHKKTHQELFGALHKVNAEAIGSNGLSLQGSGNKGQTTFGTRYPTEQDYQCVSTRQTFGTLGTANAFVPYR